MRKIRLRIFFKVILFLTIFGGFLYFILPARDLDKYSKIELIERSIRSIMNQVECRMPHLPIHAPEIMKFYKTMKKIDCGDILDDWVMCEKSICFVKPEVISKHGTVTCSYTDIIRKNDYKSRYGKSLKTQEPYVLQASDFVKVSCSAEDGLRWLGITHGIRDGVQSTLIHKPIPPPIAPLNNGDPLQGLDGSFESTSHFNVLMYGFDSLSRNAFMRKLPKTYKYLTEKLNAVVLKGYNIVGDGTTQALVPLLTGYTELELPDTRSRVSNTVSVDKAYPLIWWEFEQQGYITSFNEDLPRYGTFTYRLKGFDKQPVHHYLRTFYIESDIIFSSQRNYCFGHLPSHMVMLDYTKNVRKSVTPTNNLSQMMPHFFQIMTKYSDTPTFVFSFHGELSHDSVNLIEAADDDVVAWLDGLKQKHVLDNTILIFMSDHGNRFADVRATLQGKQEERLPFFSFAFPKSFQKRFPLEYKNFVQNSPALITPFDIHATLKHLLKLQIAKPSTMSSSTSNEEPAYVVDFMPNNSPASRSQTVEISPLAKGRAISLFDIVPRNRSCTDAYIEPHWCACLNWQPLNVTSDAVAGVLLRAAGSILDVINNATQLYRPECALFQLKRINWALLFKPHKELLTFKQSRDRDGFLPEMSDDPVLAAELYQLQIMVSPGDCLFEASAKHDVELKTMHTKLSEVSRINKYGSQANCIIDRNPELRKFCYCNKMS